LLKLSSNNTPQYLSILVLFLLLVTWFGARSLGADPYWVDEVIAAQRSGIAWYAPVHSFMDIWTRTTEASDQVPGYYLLLHLWSRFVGESPFADRALSLFCGLLSIAVVYQIGKGLKNQRAGLGAALTLGCSAFFVLFLHEMRTYTLLLCSVGFLLWFYGLIVYQQARWWAQVGLVLATATLLYSYYLSIVMIFCICFYHLLFVKKTGAWWRIVILFGLAGCLYLPWLHNSYSIFTDAHRNAMRQIHTVDTWAGIVRFLSAFSNKNILVLLMLLVFALKPKNKSQVFIWFTFIASLAIMILLNEPLGVFVNLRYSLFLWIPLSLLAGLGLANMADYGLPLRSIISLICLLGIFSVLDQKLTEEYDLPIRYLPWDRLSSITNVYEQDGDKLIFLASVEGDDWEGVHEERVMPHYFYGSELEPIFIEDVRNLPDEAFLREGQELITDAKRLWLAYAPKLRSWRTGMFESMLHESDFVRCGNFSDSSSLYLDLYLHPRALNQQKRFSFGVDSRSLAELYPVQGISPFTETNFYLIHAWELDEEFPRSRYSLAIHILDASGNLAAQADYGLPIEDFACTLSQIPAATLPQGNYQIRAFVYAWESGEHLPLLSGEDSILIGEFHHP
jgi:hypothetical protein